MSTLVRRNGGAHEVMSLRDAVDRLFEDSFVRFNEWPLAVSGESMPAVDVYETGDALTVKAVVPGFTAEQLDVEITGDVLTIKGETKQESEEGGDGKGQWHRREWRHSTFTRAITLPTSVNADKATSTYENGVLTLTLPKVEETKPKRLQVKVK